MSLHRQLAGLVLAPAFVFALLTSSAIAGALEPYQIALVVNSNVPAGRELAAYYAKVRHVPDGRIIELSIAAPHPGLLPSEDITAADYDQIVVPRIRQFLLDNGLDKKVTCLVTFWGIPLRIERRVNTPEETKETADLKSQAADSLAAVRRDVADAESLAREFDAGFHPAAGDDPDALAHRGETALNIVARQLSTNTDSKKRAELFDRFASLLARLAGKETLAEKLADPHFAALSPDPRTPAQAIAARQHTLELQKRIRDLQTQPQTAATRSQLRDLFSKELGALNLARLLAAQERMLDVSESESAFDSELSRLWWPAYPKARWEINALNWHVVGKMQTPAPSLMVMRLDGPTLPVARQIIDQSIKVEQEGLKGEVALDARGKPPSDPYGAYDQTIRDLAQLLRDKTKLKVVLDNQEALLPARSQQEMALYCGWYSLRHYVAPGQFNRGAVAFHVASSEMVSLHNRGETGWCAGLLNDGVAATLGPVAEPYLQSFPPADEFFGLLMTGKLPLAEVYWKTTPWVSWMQCCVGDPLYTPYKTNPALKASDLPEPMRLVAQ